MVIEINNTKRGVKFGYGALRRIIEHYGYTKMSDYQKLIEKFKLSDFNKTDKKGNPIEHEPNFEQLGFFTNLFRYAILNAGGKDDFTADDIMDLCMQDNTLMSALMAEFSKSMPQNNIVDPSTRVGGK